MDSVKILNCIKNEEDCKAYLQQLHSVKSCDFANVSLKESLIWNLREIVNYEFQNERYDDAEKVSLVIYKGLLNSSSTVEAWGNESKPVVSLLKHWFTIIKQLLEHESSKCWKHFDTLLSFIDESCGKHPSVRELVMHHLTGELLELATASNVLPWSAVKRTLKILNSCANNSPRELRARLNQNSATYFLQLAQLLVKCGDFNGQSILLETLLRFLVQRSDRDTRVRVAKLWFPQNHDWTHALNIFQDRNFYNVGADFRAFLNAVNQVTQLVTSVHCHSVYIGDLRLLNVEEEIADVSWVDFNHGPRTLSVNCDADGFLQADSSSAQLWETITVDSQIVTAVELVRSGDVVEMCVSLREPPECGCALSRVALQKHGHLLRAYFAIDQQLPTINKAMALIFTENFKEVDESTLKLWMQGSTKCSVAVKPMKKLHVSHKRARLSDSEEVSGNTGQSGYSPVIMQPPQTTKRARTGITTRKVSQAVRRERDIVGVRTSAGRVTPALSVASSASTSELAQLPEKLRDHNSVIYTKEMDILAMSPALTSITEEASSGLHSITPSLHSLFSHRTHQPGLAHFATYQNTRKRNTSQNPFSRLKTPSPSPSSSSEEYGISTLLTKDFEDDYIRSKKNPKSCYDENYIVEKMLREAFIEENSISKRNNNPIVILTPLDPKLMPETHSFGQASTPKRLSENSELLNQTTKKPVNVQISSSRLENSNLSPNTIKLPSPTKISEESQCPNQSKLFQPSSQLPELEEKQRQIFQLGKADPLSSELNRPQSQLFKPNEPQLSAPTKKLKPSAKHDKPPKKKSYRNKSPNKCSILDNSLQYQKNKVVDYLTPSTESHRNTDDGIIVTDISNSQLIPPLEQNTDKKECHSDVSIILDTPDATPKFLCSKILFEKNNNGSANENQTDIKSIKKHVIPSSDEGDDVIESTPQRKDLNIIPHYLGNKSALSASKQSESVAIGNSSKNLDEVNVEDFFNQNVRNPIFQTTKNPVIAYQNNCSSSDDDDSNANTMKSLPTNSNVYAQDPNISPPSPTQFVTIVGAKGDESSKINIKSNSRIEDSCKSINSAICSTSDTDYKDKAADKITPDSDSKKRRKLYSPKDAFTSLEFDNKTQKEGDDIEEVAGSEKITFRHKKKRNSGFNYTPTTSCDDIAKGTDLKSKIAPNRIRNKKLVPGSNIKIEQRNVCKKVLNRKISEKRNLKQENFNVYTFSEDSGSLPRHQRRDKNVEKKKSETIDCKKKCLRLGRSNKHLNYAESSDSSDEFKNSIFTHNKGSLLKSINKKIKKNKKSESDLLEDERMRDIAAHCDSNHLNHSLRDSDGDFLQHPFPEPNINKPHQVLQMEVNCDTKSEVRNTFIDDENKNCEGQTKEWTKAVSEKSSSDDFVKKSKKEKQKCKEKSQMQSSSNNQLVDTSNDTLPSLIIESDKPLLMAASGADDGDMKVLQALQSLYDKQPPVNAPHIQEENCVDLTTDCLNKNTCHSIIEDHSSTAVDLSTFRKDEEILPVNNPTTLSCNNKEKTETSILSNEQHLNDHIISTPGKNISFNSLKAVSKTNSLNHNYDTPQMDESSNMKLESFDTAGSSPIRAHRYSSDDLAPTVEDLNRTVSPRGFHDELENKAPRTPPAPLLSNNEIFRDKNNCSGEILILETPLMNQITDDVTCITDQTHNYILIEEDMSKPDGNENTKKNICKDELEQSRITGSEICSEKEHQLLITGNTKHLEVLQQSTDAINTKDVRLLQPFKKYSETPQKDPATAYITKSKSYQGSTVNITHSEELQEVIILSENENNLEVDKQNFFIHNKNKSKEPHDHPITRNEECSKWQKNPVINNLKRSKVRLHDLAASKKVKNQKTQDRQYPKTQTRINNQTILKIKQELLNTNEIKYVNRGQSNNNLKKLYSSSPCNESTSLFYDMSKMTKHISPIPETLSPQIARESPDSSIISSLYCNRDHASKPSDAVRTPVRPACTTKQDSFAMSEPNVDSSPLEMLDIQIRGLPIYHRNPRKYFSNSLDSTSVSQASPPPAQKSPATMPSAEDSSITTEKPHKTSVPNLVNKDLWDSLCDASSLQSIEKPAGSNTNSVHLTNWLNSIPVLAKMQSVAQFLDTSLKKIMGTLENKLNENEDESKKRWRAACSLFQRDMLAHKEEQENLLRCIYKLDITLEQLIKERNVYYEKFKECCEKTDSLMHTWKHSTVEALKAEVNMGQSILSSMQRVTSEVQNAMSERLQHDDNYFEY